MIHKCLIIFALILVVNSYFISAEINDTASVWEWARGENLYWRVEGINNGTATVHFKIEKVWMDKSNLTLSDVSIFRFNESSKKWDDLVPDYVKEDATYYHYDSQLIELGSFKADKKVISLQKEKDNSFLIRVLTLTGLAGVLGFTMWQVNNFSKKGEIIS